MNSPKTAGNISENSVDPRISPSSRPDGLDNTLERRLSDVVPHNEPQLPHSENLRPMVDEVFYVGVPLIESLEI